ncbi:MAG: hypothetical protein K5641_02920, partial [Lachnospiraceae bacterium]|nr:hypothetical protein [Lachnospiraceae bacterium]
TKSMHRVQNEIVREMKRTRRNEVDSDFAQAVDEKYTSRDIKDIRLLLLSPLDRLKDAGIVYEKEENDFFLTAFVYQKYLEYQFLNMLRKDTNGLDQVIDHMLEAIDWDSLPEMYIACLQYLKQEDNTAFAAHRLLKTVEQRGLPIERFQTVIMELWLKAALHGHVSEIVTEISTRKLLKWGLSLIKRLNEAEESEASFEVLNALIGAEAGNDPELNFLRGLYYMKVSELEKSEQDFQYCIENGDDILKKHATVQLSKTLRKNGMVEKAKKILNEYIEHSNEGTPFYADALIQRGLCKRSDKDYSEALKDYEHALSISQNNNDHYVTVYNMLGISTLKADLGMTDECERILLDVYKLAGKYGYIDFVADCLNGLSANFVRKGEYEKAISYAEQGMVIWKHSHYYAGQLVLLCTIMKALIKSGQKKKAWEYKKEADMLAPMIKEKVIEESYMETLALLETE